MMLLQKNLPLLDVKIDPTTTHLGPTSSVPRFSLRMQIFYKGAGLERLGSACEFMLMLASEQRQKQVSGGWTFEHDYIIAEVVCSIGGGGITQQNFKTKFTLMAYAMHAFM